MAFVKEIEGLYLLTLAELAVHGQRHNGTDQGGGP
jgi:hypothetical protein